jgi:hypothetical protein
LVTGPPVSWILFTAATRTFTGTPLQVDVGLVTYTVCVVDDYAAQVCDDFTITVDSNTNPTVKNEIAQINIQPGIQWNYMFPENTFEDLDGDILTYTACEYIDISTCNAFPNTVFSTSGDPLTFNQATRAF